ncbi:MULTISPECIES: DUF6448 family protein [Rhodanobacter]|uniref:DUF6448 family protein n=1 Tax=Rhodanobacter TaxID=75309 RepID=UPI000402D1BF|nr:MULTISPECIES: DUF6448 family protein [Rhodanobacter]KZC18499.1 hypothetical protein RHOFW104R3_36075 [Rhodanobacter denitrificans]UJJ49820.1 DUF6448 family protein [Rhodanobacter denitrificans]UJM92533.1 DUF6448 family protein [Rhodanobacter denitrificans]UJM96063.1 DUF6448 family protein [Rhodanobacter denitrificans]UJN21106.1 DUF6448 family protein [Rhodanobacter denitrificans]
MNFSILRQRVIAVGVAAALGLGMVGTASAHCDAADGPVITQATVALNTGDITPLLKWVPESEEATVKRAYAQARKLRQLGPEARQLADMHFFETLVRVHRASEGVAFDGVIKPAGGIEPSVAAADAALKGGNVDALVTEITGKIEHGIRARYAAARAARASADTSVANGRAYVNDYVQYIHYVENVDRVGAGTAHGAGEHSVAVGQDAH